MINEQRSNLFSREHILKLLSDEEIAEVSTAESAPRLLAGDEYIDLDELDKGVQRADGARVMMGHVLPKKAIHQATWAKVLTELESCPVSFP